MLHSDSSAFQPSILSNLSHELRTPLVGIFGMAHFLSQTALSDEQKKYPDIIADQREIKMLSETLAMSVQDDRSYLPNGYNIFGGKKYTFFHNNSDFLNEMLSPEKILLLDPDFEKEKIQFPDRIFCTTSPFFSGCIGVLRLDETDRKESNSL